jgi:hypothetical protein
VPATGATAFSYYHVVTDADAGTPGWTWTLNAAQKWAGGMSAFTNVNTTTPLDSSATTATNGSGSLSVPGVTTATAGAVIVGAMGADSGKVTGTAPSGWTTDWNTGGPSQVGQLSDSAHSGPVGVTGKQGATTWGQSGTVALAGWTVALRPKA